MAHPSHHTPHPSNFWFGFAVGSVSLATLAFFLGTKKGRELLKRALEYAENYEYNSEDFLKLLDMIVKMSRKQSEDSPTSFLPGVNVEHIMSKIKDASADKKKKFFIKN